MMKEGVIVEEIGKSEWDEVRFGFLNSLMVDTKISSLAQNLELAEGWPLEGDDEVPSKYIGFNWEQLHQLPGLADKPECINLLLTILRETMAFDDPFGEMALSVENATKEDDSLTRSLTELKIPLDLPLDLTLLEQEVLDFCAGENVSTIGDFVSFSDRLTQSGILLGGNFQGLLNALIVRDEAMIAHYLPYRPQDKGIHLLEAFGVLEEKLSDSERNSLLMRYGSKHVDGKLLLSKRVDELESKLLNQARRITSFFKSDMMEISKLIANGQSIESLFIQFSNESKMLICSALLKKLLQPEKNRRGIVQPQHQVVQERRGFFARLFKRS